MERRFLSHASAGKVLLGVVHLKPLPGSPRHDGRDLAEITRLARIDAEVILEAGFDGYLLENFGDAPFFKTAVPAHVIAILTRIALALPRGGHLAGVNVLRNDARGALAVALAADHDFIRVNVHIGAMVTDQGLIEGDAAHTARDRAALAPAVAILADLDVKHAMPLGRSFDLRESARDAVHRGLADGVIVTGKATGSPASHDDLKAVREVLPETPLLAGSGVTAATVKKTLRVASGIIVGTAIKAGGRVEEPVDPARARELVTEARG